ncbi:hypothetical protein OG422_31140 (plasmid) [Streptomyces sp. NBC_01525]|uniref:hypothetical protein n=1 Tax=Streptomyces sp. NBC_01525 TaxID=2903893 RepID=UPI002F91AF9C
MTVTPLSAARRGTGPRRYSPKEHLFIGHQEQLLALVRDQLPDASAQTVEAVVQDAWTGAALRGLLRLASDGSLPTKLVRAAGEAIGRRAAQDAAEQEVVELLGPDKAWPNHWHQLRREGGRLALLQRAVHDIEAGAVQRPLATAA